MTEDRRKGVKKSEHTARLACVVDDIASHSASGSLFDWNPDENGALSKMFNSAFKYGGLNEVDELIRTINTLLLARGAEYILRPGAAYQIDADGQPESLMVYYQKSGGTNPVCNQWIDLERN